MQTRARSGTRRWMTISALTGLAFFLIANFTALLSGLNFVAGLIQIAINAFVMVTWLHGFLVAEGRARLVAALGVIAPPVLAAITLINVILPVIAGG